MKRFTIVLLPVAALVAVGILPVAYPGTQESAPTQRTTFLAWAQQISAIHPVAEQPPGNSIEAIKYAYDLGFDGVEMDIRLAKGGVPVLLHDDTIDHTTDGVGLVADYTVADLQKFSLGTWHGEQVRVPTLVDALQANASNGVFLADMRVPADGADEIKAAVEQSGFDQERLLISCYTIEDAVIFKRALPLATVLIKEWQVFAPDIKTEWLNRVKQAAIDGIMINTTSSVEGLSELARRAHQTGLLIVTFVQGNKDTFAAQPDYGVDYVLTTLPDLVLNFKQSIAARSASS